MPLRRVFPFFCFYQFRISLAASSRKLRGVQIVIIAALFQQLPMGAAFRDLSAADHKDAVRIADVESLLRHDEARAVSSTFRDRVLNELLRLRIDGARGLVEHKDARVGKDHAGKGNELLFARERRTPPSPTSVS